MTRTGSILLAAVLLACAGFGGSHPATATPVAPHAPYAVQAVDTVNRTFPAPAENTWYAATTLTTRPGTWRLSYRTTAYAARCKTDQGTVDAFVALSTDPTRPSNPQLVSAARAGGNLYRLMQTLAAEEVVTVAQPTTWTLLISQSSDAACWDQLEFQNSVSPTVIRAERLS